MGEQEGRKTGMGNECLPFQEDLLGLQGKKKAQRTESRK